ncbi:MAG: hypothetical protein ACWA5W_05185 [Phycisphaerales bacterium]
MNRAITIAQRELISMFRVPAGWVIIALFAFLTGVLFINQTLIPGQPGSLRYFFAYSGWLMIPIAPAISMRLMSEEYRSGSIEALRTAPAGDWAVTIGKFLGSVGFLVCMLIPTLTYPIVLQLVSAPAPDLGPIFAGYLMLILVGMLYLSIGMLASSLTASQTLAFLGTVMTLILVMVVTSVLAKQTTIQLGAILAQLSIITRINELSKGIVDTSTIAFFLIGSVWMLILTSAVLEIRRLGRSRLYTTITVIAFVIATATSVAFAGWITKNYHARVDVTSLGAHQLSPRSISIVDRLTDPTEIVLAIGMNRADKHSVDLVSDVLDAYDRSSPILHTRIIDLDSPAGMEQTHALLASLKARDQSAIDENMTNLTACASTLDAISGDLAGIVLGLRSIGDAIAPTTDRDTNNKAVFEQRAQLFDLFAREITTQSKQIHTQITSNAQTNEQADTIFPFDTVVEPIESSLSKLMNQLDDLSSQITLFVDDAPQSEPAAIASPMIDQLESLRDQAAIAHDRLSRLTRIDALAVGRALETGEAMLAIGPPDQGIAAVDLDALLPSSRALEQAGISAAGVIGPRAQDLIATAIAQLVAPTQPILIFTHGGNTNQLLGSANILTQTTQRLATKGIDTLEWAPLDDPSPPNLDELDPLGIRPVVYAVLSVDSSAGSGDTGLSGAKRATEMGKVLAKLIEQGESVMVSLSPSVFPTSGLDDPIASALNPFGIHPDSGRPLMHDQIGTLGRIADPITQTIPSKSEQIVANALSGLNTVLPWAIPLDIAPVEGVEQAPLVDLLGSEDTWAEQDWLGLWRMPPQSRTLARNQPSFTPSKDLQQDHWVLAAAAQRDYLGHPQRLIAIGSNGWLTDSITTNNEQLVDGRIVSRWPGNMTLLESSTLWLANMDDLIGPGTQAKPIATIKNLDYRQQSIYRWLILAGLPGLILILGMLSRWIFG